jgi:hypothetical protein
MMIHLVSKVYNFKNFALLLVLLPFFTQNCAKYKDPSFIKIDTFSNHYCNNNKAVNYNWGFPGVADNSICIFPADVFKGNYIFYDSLQDANGIFLPTTNFNLNITKESDSTIFIEGLCASALILKAHATKNLRFTLDSTQSNGQIFCATVDTVNGFAILRNYGDSNFIFSYNVVTPTGIQVHKGTVVKN